jgi:energy-coupling factor transport system ATP-binding protein
MPEDVVFRLRDVSFSYPGTDEPALKRIELEVRSGEWVALVGSNGSGKSTLARILNALLIPTQGACFILGMDSKDMENVWTIRSKVAMVFQNPDNQIVASVVQDDTAFGPENLGLSPDVIVERVNWALHVAGLKEYCHKATYALSGGQKQRLAVAGALAMSPPVIVLDEPTAMLDPQGRKDLLKVLSDLHAQGMTIIYISHRIEEILPCDRVVVIDDGIIKWDGTPSALFGLGKGIEEWGLEVPPMFRLWSILNKEGILTDDTEPSREGVVRALCR